MADIYLNYCQPNQALAQRLKHDVEISTPLSVELQSDDCDETDDNDFEHLNHTSSMLILATDHSSITVWIIGGEYENQHHAQRRRRRCRQRRQESISFPPTIDFSQSYEDGMDTFLERVMQRNRTEKRMREGLLEEEKRQESDNEDRILPSETNIGVNLKTCIIDCRSKQNKKQPVDRGDILKRAAEGSDRALKRLEELEAKSQRRAAARAKKNFIRAVSNEQKCSE